MDAKTIGELLSRIDERTYDILKRQDEQSKKFEKIEERVGTLENWKNYFGGVTAVLSIGVSLLGYFIRESFRKPQ